MITERFRRAPGGGKGKNNKNKDKLVENNGHLNYN